MSEDLELLWSDKANIDSLQPCLTRAPEGHASLAIFNYTSIQSVSVIIVIIFENDKRHSTMECKLLRFH